jgi:hypothetical protein
VSSTPLHSVSYATPVYADPIATMGGGTPLIVAVSLAGLPDEYHITVKLQLLQAYERTIFELQQQLVHYKALVHDLLPKIPIEEQLRLDATPINEATVRLLDSIVRARITNAPLRGQDEPEEM